MKNKSRVCILLAGSLVITCTHANDAVVDLGGTSRLGGSQLDLSGNRIGIEAGTANNQAQLKIGSFPTKSNLYRWDLELSTPIDDKTDEFTLANFDELKNIPTIALNLSGISIGKREPSPDHTEQLNELCRIYMADPSWISGCSPSMITKDVYKRAKGMKPGQLVTDEDLKSYQEELVRKRQDLADRLLEQEVIKPITAHIYGLKSKAGRKSYSYVDPDTLNSQKDTETPWSISGYYFYKYGRHIFGFGAEYSESYRENSSKNICSPTDTPPDSLVCSDMKFGKPTRTIRKLANVEYRRAFTQAEVAVAPKITYDFESEETGVLIPIYFLNDIIGGWTAGVSVGWQSETDDLDGSLFISRGFKFWD